MIVVVLLGVLLLPALRAQEVGRATEIARAAIRDAKDGLPSAAVVLLQEGGEIGISVAPENLKPVWLSGVLAENQTVTDAKRELAPCFEIWWLSSRPALLRITGEVRSLEKGARFKRFDHLILYENGEPKVLLSDELLIHGLAEKAYMYSATRRESSEVHDGIVMLTFRDDATAYEANDQPKALRRNPVSAASVKKFGESEGMYEGFISTRRTRTWSVAQEQAELLSDELKCLRHPNDSWQDIAEFFLNNREYAQRICQANGKTQVALCPREGEWVTVPSMNEPHKRLQVDDILCAAEASIYYPGMK